MPEFETTINAGRVTVEEFARRLGAFFLAQWQTMNMPATPALGDNMVFLVGGCSKNKPYGDLYSVSVPSSPYPTKLIPDGQFGAYWGGQREMTDRLLQGFDPNLPDIVQEIQNIPVSQRDAGLGAKLQGRLGIAIPVAVPSATGLHRFVDILGEDHHNDAKMAGRRPGRRRRC